MENVGYPHAIRRDSEVCNRFHNLKDEQQRIQIKTFTNWINATLSKNNNDQRKVTDLMSDIKDGVILLNILETLTNSKLAKEMPKSTRRPLQINNVSTALNYLRRRGMKLVNINCTDIVDGKPSIVLGLVWKIILHLQIQNTLSRRLRRTNSQDIGKLLTRSTSLEAKDFGQSWRSGELFNKLINRIKPGAIVEQRIQPENVRENLQNAFKIAERDLDIPQLLDPDDVDVDKPDEVSIITYVGEFIKKYPDEVDGCLKERLLTRARRLSYSHGDSTLDLVRVKPLDEASGRASHETRTIPYICVLLFVILYKCIWYIFIFFIIHNTFSRSS